MCPDQSGLQRGTAGALGSSLIARILYALALAAHGIAERVVVPLRLLPLRALGGDVGVAGEEAHPETIAADDSLRRYGRNLRPMRGSVADRRPGDLPLFHYPFHEWHASLKDLAGAETPDPHLGHALEFLNPANGGPIMPTISAHVRLIPAGFETQVRRSTDASVMVVVEGTGEARVGDVDHKLSQGDIFVVPSWHALQLRGTSDLVLFAYSDRASQEKLGLFREIKE